MEKIMPKRILTGTVVSSNTNKTIVVKGNKKSAT
jgi:ribosomal protein S17